MKKIILLILAVTTFNSFADSYEWNIHDNSDTVFFSDLQSNSNMPKSTGIGPFTGMMSPSDVKLTSMFNGKLLLSDDSYVSISNKHLSYYDMNGKLLSGCDYDGQNCSNMNILKFNNNGDFDLNP